MMLRQNVEGKTYQQGKVDEETTVNHFVDLKPCAASDIRVAKAFLAMVAAAIFHSFVSLFSKIAVGSFTAPQVLLARYSVAFLYTSAFLLLKRQSPLGPPSMRVLLVARGLTGLASQFCHVFAMTRLPLASAVTLHEAFPVITIFVAPCTLGEPLTLVSVVCASFAMFGCYLIAHEESQGTDISKGPSMLGVAAGIAGAFFASSTYQLMRALMRNTEFPINQEHIIWYYAFISCLTLLISPTTWTGFVLQAPPQVWVALVGVSVTSFLEQFFVTLGFKSIPAGAGTLILTIEMALAFVYSAGVLHEPVKRGTLIGAFFIALAVMVVAIHQMQLASIPTQTQSDVDVQQSTQGSSRH
eukprot:TRINITY_DN18896_c0_g1_i2.p1 TRINITY_DN18896_c0_g1~~TRINITY_DN18896_c0_g1_i2.p1  ORF type:complete len:356 (-),score=26.69 TRINITY_DN18896_c0_g1_i2:43-1110(-)